VVGRGSMSCSASADPEGEHDAPHRFQRDRLPRAPAAELDSSGAAMKGGIRTRGRPTHLVRARAGPVNGRHRQISKGGFRRWKEGHDALIEALASLRTDIFVEPSRRTVASFLTDEWLPGIQRSKAPARGRRRTTGSTSRRTSCRRSARWSCSGSPPPTSTTSISAYWPAGAGTAARWRPRRCPASTPSSAGPSRTPCAWATWPATSPRPLSLQRRECYPGS
jgi:hypothetical protein